MIIKLNPKHIIKETRGVRLNSETCMTNHKAFIICSTKILLQFQSEQCTVTTEIMTGKAYITAPEQ